MSAATKEGHFARQFDSDEPIATQWDELANYVVDTDESAEPTIADTGEPVEAEPSPADAYFEVDNQDDEVESEASKEYSDRAEPNKERTETERLIEAIDIMDAHYFEGKPFTPKERKIIMAMGGEKVMMEHLLFEISQSYDQFAVCQLYYQNRDSLTPRHKAAIKYWAEKAGQSVPKYMENTRIRYNVQKERAANVVRQQLLREGRYDYDYLSLRDSDIVEPFDDDELQRMAMRMMYENRRGQIFSYLAGRRVDNSDRPYQPDAEARYALQYLQQYTGSSRTELERQAREMAAEVYTPNRAQRQATERFVDSHINLVTERELEQCVDSLGASGQNTTAMLRAVEQVVKRRLGLVDENITVEIDMDPNPPDNTDGVYGYYSDSGHRVKVYAGYIIRKESFGSHAGTNGIIRACNTMAHELFHAYQHVYIKKHDDRRAIMYQIDENDYLDPGATDRHVTHDQYRDQIFEREAWRFGKGFSARLRQTYGRKKRI